MTPHGSRENARNNFASVSPPKTKAEKCFRSEGPSRRVWESRYPLCHRIWSMWQQGHPTLQHLVPGGVGGVHQPVRATGSGTRPRTGNKQHNQNLHGSRGPVRGYRTGQNSHHPHPLYQAARGHAGERVGEAGGVEPATAPWGEAQGDQSPCVILPLRVLGSGPRFRLAVSQEGLPGFRQPPPP